MKYLVLDIKIVSKYGKSDFKKCVKVTRVLS